jgi:16S rRNA (cytosine1402-N4)-methyltransferase
VTFWLVRLVLNTPADSRSRTRRPRYPGRHPRQFHEKYKELNPERYVEDVERIVASGKTLAGTHRPIMVTEVLDCLRPEPGTIAVDCTLGGGGHAQAILERVQPNGRLIGLDVDPLELPRTEARLRAAGYGPDVCVVRHANFAGLPHALAAVGVSAADVILADLGVSSMQLDNPDRGFTYKVSAPLDMRMNPTRGEPASRLIERTTEADLAALLDENADEPHADVIARALKQQPVTSTQGVDRAVRAAVASMRPSTTKADLKMSVRRTLQALRIAVNDELSALDALLRVVPQCLAPGGRVAILTFHSGEDRRVKKAFQAGYRAGEYTEVARHVIRPGVEETRANRRAQSAKLRWAIRA